MHEGKLVSKKTLLVLDPHHRRGLANGGPSHAGAADHHHSHPRAFAEENPSELPLPSCASLLQLCRDAPSLYEGFCVHSAAVELAFDCSNIFASTLLHIYGRHGALRDAHHLLYRIHHRDKFTWNYMIKSYGLHGHSCEALQCFAQMQIEGVLPDMFVYASVLSECTTLANLNKGQHLHSIIASSGFSVDVVVGTAFVNMYGKCGQLAEAHKAFDTMRDHDTASWNAILSNHAQHEQVKITLDLFKQMQEQGVVPNKVTFISILPAFVTPKELATGQEVHDLVTKYGFELDLNLANAMSNMYGKCGSVEDAWALFESISDRNTLSWTVMITSLVQNGQGKDAFTLFKQMQSEGASPDKVTYVNMLSACADQINLAQGEMMHALIMHSVGLEDVELRNALLNMYSKCDNIEAARRIFDGMSERTVVSWNAMISAYLQHGQNQTAIELFHHMQTCEQVPDKVTFLSVLSAFAQESGTRNSTSLDKGMDLHSAIICYGLDTHIVLDNTLILMYGKHGVLEDAQSLFNSLLDRNVMSWNAVISEQVLNMEVAQMFSQMLGEGMMPCKGTIASLLTTCDCMRMLSFGKATHACMAVSLCGLDIATGKRLIDMYQRCGSMSSAHDVFSHMLEHDSITWTEMIAGYANGGYSKLALDLFDHMQQEGFSTDRVTYICIFSACASRAALAKGKALHACIAGSMLECDVAVGNAVLNMYGKCGNMKEAHRFFSQMPVRDVVSWSSMIANYAQHGHSKDVLQMFHEMRHGKVLPDQITFVSVLCACSHAGRVAEGCYWFEFMQNDLAIKPTLDHYNCMVDLLGRAGMLTQAEDMIRDMPFEPNVVSWMTLLGACRYHVDVERGERFADEVFKLDALDPAPYVMLSNIYFAAGREEEAARIIARMREKGLDQRTCRSLIEVGGKIHEFCDGDCLHPQSEEIQAELQTLSRKLSEIDDASSMKSTHHMALMRDYGDQDSAPKWVLSNCADINHHLLSHSEKIALAFGLISTSPGTRLFITKDSQVCFDCHSFIKLTSKLTAREIVLKDDRRFHYMQEGQCSCGDL